MTTQTSAAARMEACVGEAILRVRRASGLLDHCLYPSSGQEQATVDAVRLLLGDALMELRKAQQAVGERGDSDIPF